VFVQRPFQLSPIDPPGTWQDRNPKSPQAKHAGGVAMLVVGSVFLAGSMALIIYGIVQDQDVINYTFGSLAAIPGLAFFIPGLVLTLKYRKNGRHPWTESSE